MNVWKVNKLIKTAANATVGIVFFFVLVISVTAQRQPGRQPGNSPIERMERMKARNAEMLRREAVLSDLKRTPAKPTAPTREQIMVLNQIREDYVQLQVLSNEIMSAAARSEAFDYKQLGEQSAEINKRANRLKKSLSLPEPEDEKGAMVDSRAGENEDLKTLLLMLDKRIIAFINSPYFKNPRVINAQDSLATSAHLQNIIETSKIIKSKCKEVKREVK